MLRIKEVVNKIVKNMKILLDIQDNKASFFLELIKSLDFVTINNDGDSKESPYNKDFVAKIKKSKKEFENDDFTRVEKNDLQNFLGLE